MQTSHLETYSAAADVATFLCRNLAVNWDEGGMPWTCLPGEPSNVNWCNSAQGSELYKNPPKAWLGANDHGVLLSMPVHL